MAAADSPGWSGSPFALWFTGLPGAGKTTLATEIARRLQAMGLPVAVLDGDELRRGLNADLGFGEADREENVRRVAEVTRLFLESGTCVVAAVIAPFRTGRRRARSVAGARRLMFVYVDAPLEVCQQRDPKGLYAGARAGKIQGLTGVDAPYEPPENPAIHLRADRGSPHEHADRIIRYLHDAKRL